MSLPPSRVRRAVKPLLPPIDEAQITVHPPAADTTAASSSSASATIPTLTVDAAPEALAGAEREKLHLSPADAAARTTAYADREGTDHDRSHNNPAKAVNRKDHAAKPPAHTSLTLKQFWQCLKKTKTPEHTMNHVEAYCTANRNATVEEVISHIEKMRKTDQRIQPGTIDRMRRMLANARAGVDPLGPDPPPPDPWWVSAPGP